MGAGVHRAHCVVGGPPYQEAVSLRLRTLMDEYGVRVVELRGAVDQRVAALLDLLTTS